MPLLSGYIRWLSSALGRPGRSFARLILETSARKLLFGVFIGTHVPIIALLVYLLVFADAAGGLRWDVLGIALLATILGFGITLYVLYQFISPIQTVSKALQEYVDDAKVPDFPADFDTPAGRLMANVQYTIEHVTELTRVLERDALYDYLTGCYTRGAGAQHLRNDIARVNRGEGIFSLALLDIDNFKPLNDVYGHAFGDRCLKSLVAVLTDRLRQGDWVARWGGDEFVLVLWDVDAASAAEVLTRLTRILHEFPNYTDAGDVVDMEVSMGICQFHSGSDESALLRSADRALYAAKKPGNESIVRIPLDG